MNYEQYIIATITLARNNQEKQRIFRGIKILSQKNIPEIVAVDGGSGADFISSLSRIPKVNIVKASKPGLQNQTIKSLQIAAKTNIPYLLYTESDKFRFFDNELDQFIFKSDKITAKDKNFGLIIPSRNIRSFAKFPFLQQLTESAINKIISHLIKSGKNNDYVYGPKLVARSLLPYLKLISDKDIGWGWMSYLTIVAHKLGKRIYTISMDLSPPIENEKEDEIQKKLRLKQMKNHIEGIYLAKTLQL